RTVSMKKTNAPMRVRDVALRACRVVGKGLYGVDIKEINGEFLVVEINDNPSIYAGYEDLRDKDLYDKIISYLTE
ncbi:MAG: hypothetical protein ACM3WQ_04345, partial [Chloroflexota bacterium]